MTPHPSANLAAPLFIRQDLVKILVALAAALLIVVGGLWVAGRADCIGAVLVSWVVSWAGATGGYLLGIFPRGDLMITSRLMMSMLFRAGLPLAAVAFCKFRFPEMLDQGMVYFVVLFYLVGLLLDGMLLRIRAMGLRSAVFHEQSGQGAMPHDG